ncbi:MAG: hypothetical protein ABJG78_09135 [Cyclobacteriaceae bacterium]
MKWASPILLFLTFISYAQPLVHQEPHHIPVLESKHARVLNVVAMRGDTTQFHVHENDIAYFTVKGSNIWLQELNEEARMVNLPTGWVGSDLTHSETPLIHRFANVGENEFQLIAVEVLTDKFRDRKFTVFTEPLYEDERFSIQIGKPEVVVCEVPWVLLELSKAGEIIALDMLKKQQELELLKKDDSSRMIIIQFK